MKSLIKKKGFALLYSILLTGAILTIGVILMNIITKQLVYSSLNRQSELAYYYAANSGRECLEYYVNNKKEIFYTTEDQEGTKIDLVTFNSSAKNINCFGVPNVSLYLSNADADYPRYATQNSVEYGGVKVDLSVTFNRKCIAKESCSSEDNDLIKKSKAVMRAEGYSSSESGPRVAKRVAIAVQRPTGK